MLNEMYGKVLEVGQVESIEPDHWFGTLQSVIVPVPGRSQDHVASLHRDAFPVDGSKAALAFDDKPHGEGSVAMRGGCLVGHDKLKAGVESVGSVWSIYRISSVPLVNGLMWWSPTSGRID